MQERFDVEWCSRIPIDECGDSDIDAAEYQVRSFPSFGLAKGFAKLIFPKDQWGEVRVDHVREVGNPLAAGDDDDLWPERGRWWTNVKRWLFDGDVFSEA